ncbi:phage tail sheath subtilisin-like domain-containing protein [Acetobacter fallax]|uniref:Tail sheath protein subtilisin-like domain-containing protein n=1 Tax=Acetobacter fallax TaxID=1737473 RepID=A0ABX0KCY6_9PROT|nr:phage tail sheath subtilisin-like domain-containing protein [Acetobacter fallax]NHO33329.1 hypothetical protein [Acetobacter fallax]NHO36950.1 hypothetical protein [Acetobacter fallax]
MSGSITFGEIPDQWEVPGAYAEVTQINSGTTMAGMPLRVLLIGALSASGTGQAGTIYPNVTASSAQSLAGPGSLMAQAVKAFVTDAPYTVLDMVLVSPQPGAAKQAWTVTPQVSGSSSSSGTTAASASGTSTTATGVAPVVVAAASASGQTALQVNGVRVPVAVSGGMTAAQLGAAVAAAWTSDIQLTTGVACVADASGVLTLTAVEAGGWTADIDVRQSALAIDTVPGVSFAISTLTAGTGWPDMTPALSVTSHTWYTDIVTCLYDAANLVTFATELKRRFNAMVKLDAHGYFGARATYGQALAQAETLNCQQMTCLPAGGARWHPAVAAASLAAVASAALNTDPSRQLRGLALTALAGLGPDDADRFDESMRNILLQNGMSTFLVGQDGSVTIERAMTTYQADSNGNAAEMDARDIMVPKTATRIRYEWNLYISTTYPRAKLADDGSPLANVTSAQVVTPTVVRNAWAGQSRLYENQGWIENTSDLAKKAIFTRHATDRNRLDSYLPIQVIGALIVVASSIQLQE